MLGALGRKTGGVILREAHAPSRLHRMIGQFLQLFRFWNWNLKVLVNANNEIAQLLRIGWQNWKQRLGKPKKQFLWQAAFLVDQVEVSLRTIRTVRLDRLNP